MQESKRFGTGVLMHSTGREGPLHDPYGYDEWTIRRNDETTTLHQGLSTWVTINGDPILYDKDEECVAEFERRAGISLSACERAMNRIPPCCDRPRLESVAGYPGEHLTWCASCDKIVGSYFCRSEIE